MTVELSTTSYVTVLVIGVVVTLLAGQLLLRAGQDFLREVYDDQELAASTTQLLVTLFHLLALGALGLASTANPSILQGLDGIQLAITKVGFILLALGGVYALTVLALTWSRSHQRSNAMEDEFSGRSRRR